MEASPVPAQSDVRGATGVRPVPTQMWEGVSPVPVQTEVAGAMQSPGVRTCGATALSCCATFAAAMLRASQRLLPCGEGKHGAGGAGEGRV